MKLDVVAVDVARHYRDPVYLAEGDLEELSECPVCCDPEAPTLIAQAEGTEGIGLAVSLCRACHHAYLSRRPTTSWYQRYYAEEWDTGRNGVSTSVSARIKARVKRAPALRPLLTLSRRMRGIKQEESAYRSRLFAMLAGLGGAGALDDVPKGRLLEIGTGYGQALAVFQSAGFDTYGTEASPHRAAACRAAGHKVFDTDIDDFGPVAPFAPFDFVYSAHVFEHIGDLQRVMTQLAPLVRPGGVIYVEVPHAPIAESLVHRSHVPVHCHMFSAQSLTTLFARFGFAAVRILTDVNLHVAAVKGTQETLPIPQSGDWSRNLVWGGDVLRSATGAVNFEYDHFHAAFTTPEGKSLFQRACPYAIHRVEDPATHRLVNRFTFSIAEADRDGEWPIRFVHPSPRAPVWLKRQ